MTMIKRTLQVLSAGATAVAALAIAPVAAQAEPIPMPCAMPMPEGTLYYACKMTNTGNKTNMESFVTSNGTDLFVEDYANSWNDVWRRELCTQIIIYNDVHREAGRSDEKCRTLKNEDSRTTWFEQLTPYEAQTIAYLEIKHRRK